jgi:hypothetical protein
MLLYPINMPQKSLSLCSSGPTFLHVDSRFGLFDDRFTLIAVDDHRSFLAIFFELFDIRQRYLYLMDILPVGKSSASPEVLSSEYQQDHERFHATIRFHNG